MVVRVDVAPDMLQWAVERSRRPEEDLLKAVPQLNAWEVGDAKPTLKQLQKFAKATYTPFGYLLLDQPPADDLPIPDFRTMRDTAVAEPSPNLLDAIYLCEQRQDWYARFARLNELDDVAFVGSAGVGDDPVQVAAEMRETLSFVTSTRSQFSNWSDALRKLIDLAEAAGVMVMVSGIVGSNTHRALDPKEFRGFALVDTKAPLIFINGADTKAAQIFTLAHELAHVWAGVGGVDKPELETQELDQGALTAVERWCNQVAAEFLIPLDELPHDLSGPTLTDDLEALARRFRVSTLVALRRLFDAGFLEWDDYRTAYVDELARVVALAETSGSGGNFYYTQPLRVSRLFARAVIADTLEGHTLHREAFQLLGVRKVETFNNFSAELGVA